MPNGTLQNKQMITGLGSGFFISPDGYAVTNNHVVDHAKTVQITTDDGATYKAKVIGTDPKTDLALIKVDADKTFPYVQFAEHEPRVGDWVVAVGNPFGLGGTVTAGIVSARGRDIGSGPYDDYIQIDAPINQGNSGGPAFNVDGNVIGINTAIFSPSGGSVGIGFDIPAQTAKLVVAQLKEHGYVNRGWLGVQIQPVTAGIADSLGLKKPEGALVDQPQPSSPAAQAGIEAGDVVTAVNDKPIKGSRELAQTIGMMAPGTKIKLTLVHKGEVQEPGPHARQDAERAHRQRADARQELGQRRAASRSHPRARQRCGRRRRQGRRSGRRRSRRSGRRTRLQDRRRHPRCRRQKRHECAGRAQRHHRSAQERQARRADAGKNRAGDPLHRGAGQPRLTMKQVP